MIGLVRAKNVSDRVLPFDERETGLILAALLHFANDIESNANNPNAPDPVAMGSMWLGIMELALEYGGFDPLPIPELHTTEHTP